MKKNLPNTAINITNQTIYKLLLIFSIFTMGISFLFQSPRELFESMTIIMTSSGRLLTDYMELTSIGAAFFNAGALTLLSIFLIRWQKVDFSGPVLATIFTIFGFSLFGKNFFNSVPITIGVYLYAKLERRPFSDFILVSLFGTSLGPVVSHLAFGLGLPTLQGIFIGYTVGILVGLILPPLSKHYVSYHQGFSLYNVGFTSGIVGMLIVAILNMFGIEIETVLLIATGKNNILAPPIFCFCFILFALGFYYNGKSLKGYKSVLAYSGKQINDILLLEGFGKTLINMALQGILATIYVLLVGGDLNGPVIGGIFTIIGFSAFRKHPRNCIPIYMGVYLASTLTIHDTNSTAVLLAALFGTTLAPISEHYGSVYGIIAGFLHMSLVANVGFLHSGLNLYNNGFSGGFIAAILIPIYDAFLNIVKIQKEAVSPQLKEVHLNPKQKTSSNKPIPLKPHPVKSE